jgi:hypothetical protein
MPFELPRKETRCAACNGSYSGLDPPQIFALLPGETIGDEKLGMADNYWKGQDVSYGYIPSRSAMKSHYMYWINVGEQCLANSTGWPEGKCFDAFDNKTKA